MRIKQALTVHLANFEAPRGSTITQNKKEMTPTIDEILKLGEDLLPGQDLPFEQPTSVSSLFPWLSKVNELIDDCKETVPNQDSVILIRMSSFASI